MEDKYEEYARLYELIFTERNREEEEEFFRLATRFSGPDPDTSIADGVLKITNNDKNECAG